MARKPRLDVPGWFYHVLACGNCRAYLERYRQHDGVTLYNSIPMLILSIVP